MIEPERDLPPGVYVEADADGRTVDMLNTTGAPVVAHLADAAVVRRRRR